MKDTCKHKKSRCPSCGTGFLQKKEYREDLCPMCFIEAIEYGTKGLWVAGTDISSYVDVDSERWFHVIVNQNKQPILLNNLTYQSMNKTFPARSVYQGTLDQCTAFVKKHWNNEKKKGKGPPDANTA